MALIYIAEEDNNIREIEEYALKNSGYDVRCYADADGFGNGLREALPDLILLDIMLSAGAGLAILKKLRRDPLTKELPIMLVTVKNSEIDTVKGLGFGVDDYITKPFGIMELVARVKVLLRRVQSSGEETMLSFGPILLDQERHICKLDGETVMLTFKEYELLKLFLSNVGIVLTREAIVNAVCDSDFVEETRRIDVHVKTLRKKLGEVGSHVVTVRNVGYKLG